MLNGSRARDPHGSMGLFDPFEMMSNGRFGDYVVNEHGKHLHFHSAKVLGTALSLVSLCFCLCACEWYVQPVLVLSGCF